MKKVSMKDVRVLRIFAGIKQKDIAEKLKINSGNYCSMEKGSLVLASNSMIARKVFKIVAEKAEEKLREKRGEVERIESILYRGKNQK